MTTPSAAFRRVDGSPAYAWNGSTEGTPVVFLHGFGDMAECWYGLVDRLALTQPAYLLDAPGHGLSPLDPAADYMEQLVDGAAAFIEGLHAPVVLVGHSMGALESMYLAGDGPDLIRGIVLEDPPMAPDLSPWRDPALFEGLFGFLSSMRAQGFAAAVERAHEEKSRWDEVEYEPWVRSKQIANIGIRDNFAIHREPMETTLSRIRCPALLLTGNPACGAIVEPASAQWAQERCPTLEVHNFPTASHDVRRDQADAVAPLVRQFIAQHSV